MIHAQRLGYPVNIMHLDEPEKYFIDCPIDTFPKSELRTIEIPRELARYITVLQDKIARYEGIQDD